ncbi:TIGR00341 family protein [Cytobacillus spongiae]|uniref:TIGR00341 family protein n=1 Tax=Cytobacillus spongiae TaxID=2901381 RepID=UPI001F2AFAC2|nr:TIGR00341 family protein [Cytobacillus spongiae]UII56835.1 TIGR00341 family protein [Cytobacillus spongiae]
MKMEQPIIEHSIAAEKQKRKRYNLSEHERNRIIKKIGQESQPDAYFYIMVVLSCSVATYGLLSNSTAVIIGAMLIAPLMNPILGGALALITGNNRLLRVTIKAELIGAMIAIVLSTLLTLFLPVAVLTPEVLARTEPTLIDLIIALASGAAGTYAICYRAGATLPGVAIATALMPPLCVVGISIAKQEFHLAGGALLLFFVNMLAIHVIGILIFKIAGFTTPSISNYFGLNANNENQSVSNRIVQNKIIYPITLLLLVSIPLIFFMSNSIDTDRTEKLIRAGLEEGFVVLSPDSKLVSVHFDKEEQTYVISTEIHTDRVISPDDIRTLENSLEYRLAAPVRLTANVSLIQKVSNESSTNAFQSLFPTQQEKVIEVIESDTPEHIIEQTVDEKLLLFEGYVLEDFVFQYQKGSGTYQIQLQIKGEKFLDEQFSRTIETVLEDKLKRKVLVTLIQEAKLTEDIETDEKEAVSKDDET